MWRINLNINFLSYNYPVSYFNWGMPGSYNDSAATETEDWLSESVDGKLLGWYLIRPNTSIQFNHSSHIKTA